MLDRNETTEHEMLSLDEGMDDSYEDIFVGRLQCGRLARCRGEGGDMAMETAELDRLDMTDDDILDNSR